MIATTITEIYQPVARYLAWLTAQGSAPPVPLLPLDAFLLVQLARFLPDPPAVLDLAAPATAGSTAILWAAQRQAVHTVEIAGEHADLQRFAALVAQYGVDTSGMTFTGSPSAALEAGSSVTTGADGDSAQPRLLIAPPNLAGDAAAWLAQTPAGCAVILGCGPTGASPGLEQALTWAGSSSPYCLTLLRELAPALAASQLVCVHQREWDAGAASLERIAWLFQGNFDFLRLAAQNVQLQEQCAAQQRQIEQQQAEIERLHQAAATRPAPAPAVRRLYRASVPLAWRKRVRSLIRGVR
jgi:hypothetical protein